MAHDKAAADRLRIALARRTDYTERAMFGGICFFLAGNMLCGTGRTSYMFRVGKDSEAEALARKGAAIMMLGGKRMGGIIEVDIDDLTVEDLDEWLALAERFVGALPAKGAKT